MAIIGIDLGTSNTLACVFQDGQAHLIPNPLGGFLTKSAVSLLEDGSILTGAPAKERLITHPDRTAASYKVFMGTQREFVLGGQRFRPEELSALVLRQIKADAARFLGEEVQEAVISVPAYFNDNQRCATKLAAELAGLKVSRLINEPSAAAVYYRWHNPEARDGKLMIVDFGGGTLDVSIVDCFENIIEIVSIAGDNHLGGDDIDRAIAQAFCEQNHLIQTALTPQEQSELLWQAEHAKLALSPPGAEPTTLTLETASGVFHLTLDQEQLAQLCAPLFRRVEKVLRQALENHTSDRIQQVVLVGGSAHLWVFQDFLTRLMSVPPVMAADPDRIVAMGAGVCAGIKERREELQDIVMTDVCPFSLGVGTYSHKHDQEPHMAVIIPRSSMLPISHSQRFYTLNDRQDALRFEVYQGEDYFVAGNLKLGELRVRVPRGPAGSQWADVTFTYDINGILHVQVKASGGDYQETVILNPNLHLTDQELAEAMERIRQIQLYREQANAQPLFETALELFRHVDGFNREALSRALENYGLARDSNDRISLRQAELELEATVNRCQRQLSQIPSLFIQDEPDEEDFWLDEEEEGEDDDV